jgi:hypothetical protein
MMDEEEQPTAEEGEVSIVSGKGKCLFDVAAL